jgi:hypothetical protein
MRTLGKLLIVFLFLLGFIIGWNRQNKDNQL